MRNNSCIVGLYFLSRIMCLLIFILTYSRVLLSFSDYNRDVGVFFLLWGTVCLYYLFAWYCFFFLCGAFWFFSNCRRLYRVFVHIYYHHFDRIALAWFASLYIHLYFNINERNSFIYIYIQYIYIYIHIKCRKGNKQSRNFTLR